MNLSQKLRLVSLDKKQWQRLYYKNQQAYIRQRLSAIRYLSEGKSRAEVAQLVGRTDGSIPLLNYAEIPSLMSLFKYAHLSLKI